MISTKLSQNQSSKVEKNKTTETEDKTPDPLHKDGDTQPRISAKLLQNQSSKVEKNKTTETKDKTPNRYTKTGSRSRGSQQNHRKTNLAKLKKTKLL